MLVGNPVFSKIPAIIGKAKAEFKSRLVEHLATASALNFGLRAGAWLAKNYTLLEVDTFTLCKGFEIARIVPEHQTQALNIHRYVEVRNLESVWQFCLLAEVHHRKPNCYSLWGRLQPFARLTQTEYN